MTEWTRHGLDTLAALLVINSRLVRPFPRYRTQRELIKPRRATFNSLLDEFRIWLHPVLSGNAKPSDLLYGDALPSKFALTGTDV
jgi:hypothetical protein